MKKNKNIVFCGGKDVGYGCLEYLIQQGYNVVAVFTNPSDISSDRWYKSVAELSWKNNIPVFCPDNINNPDSLEKIKFYNPSMIISIYYDQILKKDIIELVKGNCINLHMALAEEYRGCYPTTWAIINGETKTGVTLHYLTTEIDAGDIIAQVPIFITKGTTGESLYYECTTAGIKLFSYYFSLIFNDKIDRKPQITTEKTKYYKRKFPDRELDFSLPGEQIYNRIRALIFKNFPPPFFYIGDRKFIIKEEIEK